MAARLPPQGLPACPANARPAAPEQNGGPAPPAECRGHVMAAPPRPSGGRRRRELGVPPRRATASRGRRGLAAVRSVEWRSGGAAEAAELGARCPVPGPGCWRVYEQERRRQPRLVRGALRAGHAGSYGGFLLRWRLECLPPWDSKPN